MKTTQKLVIVFQSKTHWNSHVSIQTDRKKIKSHKSPMSGIKEVA